MAVETGPLVTVTVVHMSVVPIAAKHEFVLLKEWTEILVQKSQPSCVVFLTGLSCN